MNKYLYVVEGKTDVAKLKNLGAEYVLKLMDLMYLVVEY